MEAEIFLMLGLLGLFLLGSAFCSGSETGLTVASKANLHKLAGEGSKGAQKALNLRKNKDRLIGTLLLGNNAMNTALSVVGASFLATYVGNDEWGVVITTAILTLTVLLFGEVLPKIYAFSHADKVAIIVSHIWSKLVYVFYPITKLIEKIAAVILRLLGNKKSTLIFDPMEEIRGAIEMHHEEGGVVKDDRDMLGSILDLSQIEVGDIMIHRRDITSLNINDAPKLMIDIAIESLHSRIPVWEKTEENIIGILHTKDVLKIDRDNPTREQILALLKEPMFIPETTSLRDQLEKFRRKRMHLAIVVDEYGSLMGLITLEDILEEIVGQIDDEHDTVVKGIKRHSDGTYTIRGNINIRDLNREMDWQLPTEEDAHTLAGLVIKIAENIPEVGEKFELDDFEFTVVGKYRNQITSIKAKQLADDSDEQE
jgi:Mg2+/Co2+ transporter CorB